MSQKFCTHCGAPLDENAKFCTSCGEPVEEDATPLAQTATLKSTNNPADADLTGQMLSWEAFPEVPEEPVVPPTPAPTTSPQTTTAFPSYVAQPNYEPQQSLNYAPETYIEKEDTSKKVLIGVGAAAATVAVILVVLLFTPAGAAIFGKPANQNTTAATQQTQPQGNAQAQNTATPAPSTQNANTATNQSAGTSTAEPSATQNTTDSYTTQLNQYYAAAGSYDSQIASAAKTFNAHWTDTSSSRYSLQSDCESILSSVKSDRSALAGLNVPSSSQNYQAWQDLCTCYDDLVNRIDVIAQAWSIATSHSDPSGYKNEVMAPLRSEVDASGKNKYYNDYQSRYQSIVIK